MFNNKASLYSDPNSTSYQNDNSYQEGYQEGYNSHSSYQDSYQDDYNSPVLSAPTQTQSRSSSANSNKETSNLLSGASPKPKKASNSNAQSSGISREEKSLIDFERNDFAPKVEKKTKSNKSAKEVNEEDFWDSLN